MSESLTPDPPITAPPIPQVPQAPPTKIMALKILFKSGHEHVGRFVNPRMNAHNGQLLTFIFDEAVPDVPFVDVSSIAMIITI